MEEIHPWYRGFNGEIIAKTGKDKGSYMVRGAYTDIDENTIEVIMVIRGLRVEGEGENEGEGSISKPTAQF